MKVIIQWRELLTLLTHLFHLVITIMDPLHRMALQTMPWLCQTVVKLIIRRQIGAIDTADHHRLSIIFHPGCNRHIHTALLRSGPQGIDIRNRGTLNGDQRDTSEQRFERTKFDEPSQGSYGLVGASHHVSNC